MLKPGRNGIFVDWSEKADLSRKSVWVKRLINLTELQRFLQEELENIPANQCEKLVEGYNKNWLKVKRLKANDTKHYELWTHWKPDIVSKIWHK